MTVDRPAHAEKITENVDRQTPDREAADGRTGERAPRAFDPTRATAGADRWRRLLAETDVDDQGPALDDPRRLLAMLKVFGSTQRLADACLKYPIYAAKALREGPSPILAEAARDLSGLAVGVGGAEALYGALSPIKARADLAIAIAEIAGDWTTSDANAARADLAERLVETALSWLVRASVSRGELPAPTTGDDQPDAGEPDAARYGVFALAGGDFAHEDLAPFGPIDLLIIYDNAAFEGPAARMAERAFVRIGAELREALEGKSGDHAMFALKSPMGAVVDGQGLIESRARIMQGLENGQTGSLKRWVAVSRVVAGDRTAGGRFLEAAEEAIWRDQPTLTDNARKELFATDDDPRTPFRSVALAMRWSLGRARPVLRTAPARTLIQTGARTGVLPRDVAERLVGGLELAQTIVARAQSMKGVGALDAATPDERDALAALASFDDAAALSAARDGAIADARNALSRLVGGAQSELDKYAPGETGPDDAEKLRDLGFLDGADLSALIDGWAALCNAGPNQRFASIAPGLLTAFGETQHPDEAARLFDRLAHVVASGETDDGKGYADRMRAVAEVAAVREPIVDALGAFGAAVEPLLETAEDADAFFERRGPETPTTGAEFLSRFAPPKVDTLNVATGAIGDWRRRAIARVALFAAAGDMSFDAAASALRDVHAASLGRLFDAALNEADGDPSLALYLYDRPAIGAPGVATPMGFVVDGEANVETEGVARRFLDAVGALGQGYFAVSPAVTRRPGGVAGTLTPDVAAVKSFIQSEAIAQDQILLARTRVVAGNAEDAATTALRAAVSNPRRADVLLRDLDRARAQRMRRERASSLWELDQAEGGLHDVDLIVGALIYRHAGAQPALQTETPAEALDVMARAGIVGPDVAETLKGALNFWTRLAIVRQLARWSEPSREPVRRRFAALIARAAEVDNYAAVRPIMRGYADEVSRLYAQLVLGRPSIGLVAQA
ncbi:MAG: hypothetical protein ACFB00_00515 [Parvularculaceae bacterium]